MTVTPAEGKWNKTANGTDLVWGFTWELKCLQLHEIAS